MKKRAQEPQIDAPNGIDAMNAAKKSRTRWRVALILLVLVNIYITGSAFSFRRLSFTIMDPFDFSGPTGRSVLCPRGAERVQSALWYLYYPVRKIVRAKDWAWFVRDPLEAWRMDEEELRMMENDSEGEAK